MSAACAASAARSSTDDDAKSTQPLNTMPDATPPNPAPENRPKGPDGRPLSEIGHLFLSSVRDKQTGGAPRPQRKPPGTFAQNPADDASKNRPRTDVSIDLTPEEFA